MRTKAAVLVTFLTFLSAQLMAQDLVDKPAQEPKRPVAALENKETLALRRQAIGEVRTMAARVLRFQDSQLKIRTLISLADVLWGKGKDELEARLLFLKADELIRSVRVSKDDDPAIRAERNRDAASISASVLNSLKRLLVQRVSPHDPALGQRLSREYGLGDGSLADIAYQDYFEVSGMIKRGQIASATKALQNRINDNPSGLQALLSFLNLLFELRTQDVSVADGVFIEAMVRMGGQPNVAANDVLIIGRYLFGPRFMSPKNLADPRRLGTSPIKLGDVVVQSDVAQAIPGITTAAARAYLGTATQILGRGSYDLEETKRRAVAAYLLRPHAQALAPEFVAQLLSIQTGPGIDFSPSAQTNPLPLKDGKIDLGSVLESIEAFPAGDLRDQFVLKTFRLLYDKGELDAALTVGEKIGDAAARDQLVSLISFAQGAKAMEAAQIETAQKSVSKVTSSLQRFLLRLGLASLYLKQRDKPAAEALLNEAIKDSRDDGDTLQQPYVILSAVEMLASFNRQAATDRLGDAIRAFNALGARRAQTGPTFNDTVKVGAGSAIFNLRLSGVKYGNFAAALKPLSADPPGVSAILLDLRDENILSNGMIAFGYAFL